MNDNETTRLSRLTAILIQLQTKQLITATMLADKFSVSVRTIYRDIRALEQSGVPILTEEGKGYSLMEGYRIPPVTFTESEANALITAEQFVLRNKDASFVKEFTGAISKIKSVLRQTTKENANLLSDRIAVSQNSGLDRTSNYLVSLQLALTNFNLAVIDYQKPDTTEVSKRVVEPFALLSTQENWLLVAWCRLRKEFRIFRLDRITSLLIQNEKFEPHKITLQDFFALSQK
ncbi:helix-turn-helix transcriptional regulator [Solitalea canadensis]|uniref:Putative transcriptional regulator n=1 Tax=Solitalea canadensis (strain ATCC 29591 / DSM 3403 / JCM 21819 / LMG 8368 / NBRC 15130 / NCIMB 12057 / USAM 9D) TaxID=929556 RepID=H8KMY9_SOLCM|nr:YafY family protein [Solitalea canadensis]AFD09068.1 putative transcriptional regulator [Solitalea canadensis DSM 3403]